MIGINHSKYALQMLSVSFDESRFIITLEPDGQLTIEGFHSSSRIIDEYLSLKGQSMLAIGY